MAYLKPLYKVDSKWLPWVAPKVPDGNVGIQLGKTRNCSVCSRISEVIFTKEELKGAWHVRLG
jgi:hypothetical protein